MSNKIGNAYGLKNTADESYTLIMYTNGRSGSNYCMFTDDDVVIYGITEPVIYGITEPNYYLNVGADDDVDYDENGYYDYDNVDDD